MSDSLKTIDELRDLIIKKFKEKRPDDSARAEEIANLIVSQPYINENTIDIFLESSGLLEEIW